MDLFIVWWYVITATIILKRFEVVMWDWVCEGCNRFAAAVKLEKQLADIPEKEHLLRALQKRRLNRYDGFLDRVLTELYITGKHTRMIPHMIWIQIHSNSNRVFSSFTVWCIGTCQYFQYISLYLNMAHLKIVSAICHYTRKGMLQVQRCNEIIVTIISKCAKISMKIMRHVCWACATQARTYSIGSHQLN